MSFSSYTPLAVYPGNGSTTVFPLPDKFYDADDVSVYLVEVSTGIETQLTNGVDFSVIVTLEEASKPGLKSGNVSLVLAPSSAFDVVPFLLPPVDQDQKFEGRPVTPRMQERVHDRHSMRHAGLLELFFRGYRSPLNTPPGLRFIAAGREGYVPTWDADGNLIEGPTVGQVAIVAANIQQVNTVAAIAPQVVTVSDLEDEIRGLYPVRSAIGQLGPVAGQIAALAPLDDELIALAPVATQIAILGSGSMPDAIAGVYSIRNQIVIVAGADDDIEIVAANIAAIIAAANAIPDLAAKLNRDGSNVGDALAQAAFRAAIGAISAEDVPPVDNLSADVITSGIFNVGRIPTLDINAKTSGILSIANGGSGQTTEAGLRGAYTGTSNTNTAYPIGSYLLLNGSNNQTSMSAGINDTLALRLVNGRVNYATTGGSAIPGTWRLRSGISTNSSGLVVDGALVQRVS